MRYIVILLLISTNLSAQMIYSGLDKNKNSEDYTVYVNKETTKDNVFKRTINKVLDFRGVGVLEKNALIFYTYFYNNSNKKIYVTNKKNEADLIIYYSPYVLGGIKEDRKDYKYDRDTQRFIK